MPRIKIQMPTKILDTVIVDVRITDLNYGNHVGNDSVVTLLHEARVKWLARYGYTEFNAGGNSLIMGHLAVEYKKEIKYPATLQVAIAIDNITSVGFEIFYEMKSEDGTTHAKAFTGMVCYDYEKGKLALITEALTAMLKK